ncbi:Crp/Fnr family transcriptional regulator [Hymenobacter volaticus]|uniref:Crp/Fnr family transcriptional regulator n=1 Tax=Hymenobacter volaticus TaxID=2932254 RepID=A0ABY4GEG6_9BACT|nr:Crp/Fnr family transcriptional regulator [Hymenobacter volaticus]UOQ69328.1 Crp/Fnr family transcriptional regulator [Hymenobacter volaticus]
MVETFRKYVTARGSFTEAELEQIEAVAMVKNLKRRQFLLREGEVCRHMAFVVSGSMRLYRTDEYAVEHIIRFATENWWISDHESFHNGQPAKGAVDALEDSQLLLWSRENWDLLKKEIPAFNALQTQLISRTFDAQVDRLYAAISRSPEERYHAFVKAFPGFYQRVPLHMIASYLGVSRKTLGRIRKQASSG